MENTDKDESTNPEPYFPDDAVTDPKDDRFQRWPFAQRIAQTIVARKESSCIVIGVYGAWGDGKTSVLNFIERELRQSSNIVCLKFNPWRFGDEATLIRSFFHNVANALSLSLSTRVEKIGELLNQYSSVLAPLSLALGSVVSVTPGESLKELGKSLSSVDLETLKERIAKLLVEARVRVVILMDDIDRLDNIEINSIFKLIKLTADFSNTAYVLAFDNRMVAAALREKYAAVEEDAGESFLDKIIQVPLHLPKADNLALRELCFEGVNHSIRTARIDLTQEEADEFAHRFVNGIEIRLKTPRSAKRYSNALLFSLPLLKGEVNPVDLMLIEAVRVFYPRVYTFVRANRDLYLGTTADYSSKSSEIDSTRDKLLSPAFDGLNTRETNAAKSVLKELFPRFLKTGYGSNWEEPWAKEKRIASRYYFDRYFSYAVSDTDIPDGVIQEMLHGLSSRKVGELVEILDKVVTQRNAANVILKLRTREREIPSDDAKRLGLAISRSGRLLPNPEILFSHTTAFSQAAILVAKMSQNLQPGEERLDYAKEIIERGDPLSFSIEAWRWFRSEQSTTESDRKLTIDQEEVLSQTLARRIKLVAQSEIPYLVYPRDSMSMLGIWAKWISRDETNRYLEGTFKESGENVLTFLKTYLTRGWEVESGRPSSRELSRDGYDSITRVVEPSVVMHHLVLLYGMELSGANLDAIGMDASDKGVALRFAAFHSSVTGESANKTDVATQTKDAAHEAGNK